MIPENRLQPLLIVIFLLLSACNSAENSRTRAKDAPHHLHDIPAYREDSFVNAVIEIPAGTNQKWEVNKVNGQIEWEQVNPDSSRVIDYLAYPANYGFVPQTLLPKANGGDGDPVDVFVLGPAITRGAIVGVRIVGIIHMLDDDEMDSKLLAVSAENEGLHAETFQMLVSNYPGVLEILQIWLSNYKGPGRIEILSVQDEQLAIRYLEKAHNDYINLKKEKL
jgi:inorganic pyrophosphatase